MIALNPSTKSTKVGLSIAIAGAALIPLGIALFPTQPKEQVFSVPLDIPNVVQIDPTWDNNPNYCQNRPIEDCHTQFSLRMQQYRDIFMEREALRFRSEAVNQSVALKGTQPLNPACYKQSDSICLAAFAEGIINGMSASNSNADWLAQVNRAIALSNAQMGKINQVPVTPNRFTILATNQTFQDQLAIYYGQGEKEARIHLEGDKENGIAPSKPLQYQEKEVAK